MDDVILNNTVILLKYSWNDISFVGSNKSDEGVTVHCEGNSGILLQNMTGFSFERFHFSRCSYTISWYHIHHTIIPNHTSVMILNSDVVRISNCFFMIILDLLIY